MSDFNLQDNTHNSIEEDLQKFEAKSDAYQAHQRKEGRDWLFRLLQAESGLGAAGALSMTAYGYIVHGGEATFLGWQAINSTQGLLIGVAATAFTASAFTDYGYGKGDDDWIGVAAMVASATYGAFTAIMGFVMVLGVGGFLLRDAIQLLSALWIR